MLGELLILPTPQKFTSDSELYQGPNIDLSELDSYLIGLPCPKNLQSVTSLPEDHPKPGPEAYSIVIEESSICLFALHPQGFLYGIQTLRQIVSHFNELDSPIHQMIIHDWPQLSDRGFMLDVSRNRIPLRSTLLRLLEYLKLLKYNHFELYFEQVFQYKGHEEVWMPFGGISTDDLNWLHHQCKLRGLELVPNQNSFGHMKEWLKHETYRPLAEAPDGFLDPWGNKRDYPFSLSPQAEGVEQFLRDLYSQLLPHFSSNRFNVGLDETFDLGQGKSVSRVQALEKEFAKQNNITPDSAHSRAVGRVYLDMWMRIYRLVEETEKTMVFWGDIIQNHPELITELPRNILAIEWGYEEEHPFNAHCERLSKAKIPFLVAPGTCSWNSPAGRYATAEGNIRNSIHSAFIYGAQGMLLTDWGDNGHLQPLEVSLPPVTLAGAACWNYHDVNLSREQIFHWTGKEYFGNPTVGEVLRQLTTLDETYHLPRIMNNSILGIALVSFDNPLYQSWFPFDDQNRLHEIRTTIHRLHHQLKELVPLDSPLCYATHLAEFAVAVLQSHQSNLSNEERDALVAHHQELRNQCIRHWEACYIPSGLDLSLAFLDKAVKKLTQSGAIHVVSTP